MDRVEFMMHQGTRVLRVDFCGLRDLAELQAVAEQCSRVVRAEPPGSVISLIDLRGVPFSLRMVRMLGEMAAGNAEYVRARAILGVAEIALPSVRAVAEFTGRPAEAFSTREEALDWLIRHAPG